MPHGLSFLAAETLPDPASCVNGDAGLGASPPMSGSVLRSRVSGAAVVVIGDSAPSSPFLPPRSLVPAAAANRRWRSLSSAFGVAGGGTAQPLEQVHKLSRDRGNQALVRVS